MIWSEGPCDTSCLTAGHSSTSGQKALPLQGKRIQEASADVILQHSGGKAHRVKERSKCSQANECADIQHLKYRNCLGKEMCVCGIICLIICNHTSHRSPQQSWEWRKLNTLALQFFFGLDQRNQVDVDFHTHKQSTETTALSPSLSMFLFLSFSQANLTLSLKDRGHTLK